MGLGHPLRQLLTALDAVFDNLNLKPRLLQHEGQVHRRIAAAGNEYGMNGLFPEAQPLEHTADLRHGDHHGDLVPGPKLGIAAGDHHLAVPFPGANQHFAPQHIVDGHHILAVQRAVFFDLKADHVDLTLIKGVHIQR